MSCVGLRPAPIRQSSSSERLTTVILEVFGRCGADTCYYACLTVECARHAGGIEQIKAVIHQLYSILIILSTN